MHTTHTTLLSTAGELTTERLTLRPWRVDVAQSALDVYRHGDVARWLSSDKGQVPNLAAMRAPGAMDRRGLPVGYASETTHALATWAFSQDVYEIFAVVEAGNARAAATVRHNGMQWVGETSKYFGADLQVFRLRMADLDRASPEGSHPPNLTH